MADPTPFPGREQKLQVINDRWRGGGGGGGDGPTSGGNEFRLVALERAVEKIDNKLEIIGKSIVKIETKLEHVASSTEVAAIKGRVDSLPTTWQMITLVFGILGGAFVILRFGLQHGP